MKHRHLILPILLTAAVSLFSCSPQKPSVAPDHEPRSGDKAIDRNSIDAMLNNPKARPGLATGWGERQDSAVFAESFVRASSKPAGTDAIYYNDPRGIEAMAETRTRVGGLQQAAGGLVEWGVKGPRGFLATFKDQGSGRRLVAGESAAKYTIAVRNRSQSRLEVVASVDGLDVMDGKSASFSKRGYIVSPGETLEIDGFRTSNDSVAAFRFSSVASSYANQRHGDTRNVGILGLAVFTQKGVDPWTRMPAEAVRRGKARAFAEAP